MWRRRGWFCGAKKSGPEEEATTMFQSAGLKEMLQALQTRRQARRESVSRC